MKNFYLNEMAKAWGNDAGMMAYFSKNLSGAYAMPNGGVMAFDKQKIKTDFCYGENGYDYNEAQNRVHNAYTNEDYFRAANLAEINRLLNLFKPNPYGTREIYLYRKAYTRQEGELNIWNFTALYVCEALENRNHFTDLRKATAEECKAIVKALKEEKAKQEKKINAYLKRFGLSKVRAWSYWTEA